MTRLVDAVLPPRLGHPFRWQVASSWVGQLGDGVALAAGPLLVASQTRSALLIAAAAMVQQLPALLFGLWVGAVVDRVDRRRLVLGANLVRVAVLAVLVTVVVTGTVTIWLLLAVLFLVGVAELVADTGWRAVLPSIVPRADLGVANARMMSGFLVGNQMVGPALGASLFAVGAAVPFGAQALALLLAAVLFAKVRVPPVPGERAQQHLGRDVLDGLRWIAGNPPVRTLTLVILLFNITWGAPWGVLVFWAQERLGVDDVRFGLLTTAVAVGGLAAVLSYDGLERRVPVGRLMKACLALEVLTHLAFAVTTSWWVAMAVMVVFGGYAFVWGSLSSAVRQRATPAHLQGRVGSVYWVGLVGGLLLGQLAGGLLAEHVGPAAPFWFAFVGSGVTLALLWTRLDRVAAADASDGEPGDGPHAARPGPVHTDPDRA